MNIHNKIDTDTPLLKILIITSIRVSMIGENKKLNRIIYSVQFHVNLVQFFIEL